MTRDIRMDLEIAANFGECSVCFEPLCLKGASVMTDGQYQAPSFFRSQRLPKRICRHFICKTCAPTIIQKKCPVCRREYEATFDVPDPLAQPRTWFQLIDLDQDDHIDKPELVDALKGMFSVEPRALEQVVEANWSQWDTDNNGTIDLDEFRNQLAPFLASTIKNLAKRLDEEEDFVDLQTEPAEWFRKWDEDGSGSLERKEIVRALVKTVPSFSGKDDGWLSETFMAVWSLFDPDEDGSITEAEFVMPDGLYDTLVATFFNGRQRMGNA